MPSIQELHNSFFGSDDPGIEKDAQIENEPSGEEELARALGINKASSAAPNSQENEMKSLSAIYNGLVDMEKAAQAKTGDQVKTAAAKKAELEKKAEAMARAELTKEAQIKKVAAEYDAAGRIMARGFADEFMTQMGRLQKLGMEGYVAGQIENDLDPSRTAIPTTGAMKENGDLANGAESSTVEGVKNQLGVTGSGLGGGETTKIMTVRDQLGQPAAASATNLGG